MQPHLHVLLLSLLAACGSLAACGAVAAAPDAGEIDASPPCGTVTCDPHATCLDPETSACACNTGFDGPGTTCTDTNECDLPATCPAEASCENTEGSFACHCKVGYRQVGSDCEPAWDDVFSIPGLNPDHVAEVNHRLVFVVEHSSQNPDPFVFRSIGFDGQNPLMHLDPEIADPNLDDWHRSGYTGFPVGVDYRNALYDFGDVGMGFNFNGQLWFGPDYPFGLGTPETDLRDGESPAVQVADSIIFVGGRSYPGRVRRYAIDSNQMQLVVGNLPSGRTPQVLMTFGNPEVYAYGASDASDDRRLYHGVLNLSVVPPTMSWEELVDGPSRGAFETGAAAAQMLWIGVFDDFNNPRVARFDTSTGSWLPDLLPLPDAVNGFSWLMADDDQVYLLSNVGGDLHVYRYAGP